MVCVVADELYTFRLHHHQHQNWRNCLESIRRLEAVTRRVCAAFILGMFFQDGHGFTPLFRALKDVSDINSSRRLCRVDGGPGTMGAAVAQAVWLQALLWAWIELSFCLSKLSMQGWQKVWRPHYWLASLLITWQNLSKIRCFAQPPSVTSQCHTLIQSDRQTESIAAKWTQQKLKRD